MNWHFNYQLKVLGCYLVVKGFLPFGSLGVGRFTAGLITVQIIFELGQYVMKERDINFMDYEGFFSGLGYMLSNATNNKPITNTNYKNMIPKKGTIDVLAIPV